MVEVKVAVTSGTQIGNGRSDEDCIDLSAGAKLGVGIDDRHVQFAGERRRGGEEEWK